MYNTVEARTEYLGSTCLVSVLYMTIVCGVGIATGYDLTARGSILDRGKIFVFSTASRPTLGPTQLPLQWVPGFYSREVKRPGREADHSPPSSAEVKNSGATHPLPHTSSWRDA
jgi:hypothetical protein